MLKARDNPLASERVEALIRYRPVGWTWEELFARAAALAWRCAIVGPKGSGKTTLLEDLCERIAADDRSWRLIRLSSANGRIDAAALRDLRRDEVVMVDGVEQLSPARWAWLRWRTRAAGGLLITTHTPGRLPTLLETRTSPRLLQEILIDLLGSTAPPAEVVEPLFHCHQGNVREAIRELYDRQ